MSVLPISQRTARRVPRLTAAQEPVAPTLAALPIGSRAIVVGMADDIDPRGAARLRDLGFAPGAVVSVVRRAPLRDPVVFAVADYEVALRKTEAGRILVEPAGE